ncbi:MAG: thiamine pyrophosphate-dependent dehydrogenase E1 component subunit alpha [Planctomycetota bacterium]
MNTPAKSVSGASKHAGGTVENANAVRNVEKASEVRQSLKNGSSCDGSNASNANQTKMGKANKSEALTPEKLLRIHEFMVMTRVAEEQCIRMSRAGDGWFWIGAPGEEALGVPLGMQVKKGEGLDYDFLHLHYRSSPVVMPMGLRPIDMLRQMAAKATDPFSRGRNFVNHFAIKKWNVAPMAPTIQTQYSICIGTGIAQRRHGGTGITIVNGGDGGTHEGDFASCLIWATRPNFELPILMITANNKYAISTGSCTQHGTEIIDRARGFKIPAVKINGNDVFESWHAISEAMDYVRTERKPYFIEASVSRLNGHSSSSGANRVEEEDCIQMFEEQLLHRDIVTKKDLDRVWDRWREQLAADYQIVKNEPFPPGDDIWKYIFKEPKSDYYNPEPSIDKKAGR